MKREELVTAAAAGLEMKMKMDKLFHRVQND